MASHLGLDSCPILTLGVVHKHVCSFIDLFYLPGGKIVGAFEVLMDRLQLFGSDVSQSLANVALLSAAMPLHLRGRERVTGDASFFSLAGTSKTELRIFFLIFS